jgi:hypothetical protein
VSGLTVRPRSAARISAASAGWAQFFCRAGGFFAPGIRAPPACRVVVAVLPAAGLELTVDAKLGVEQELLHVKLAQRWRRVEDRLAVGLAPHAVCEEGMDVEVES